MADKKTFTIQVQLDDNSPEALAALKNAIYRGLWAIGATAEGHAKDGCPVDTGLLRNSITFAVGGEPPNITAYKADKPDKNGKTTSGSYPRTLAEKGTHVFIGTNVEYAPYQEFGTSKGVKPKHFLLNAAANHTKEYKEILLDSLKNA